MRVDLFDFSLPPDRIAERPASPRDSARLLTMTRDALVDRVVRDLPDMLKQGDVLVFNNTRVIPARLFGTRGQVEIEVLLYEQQEPSIWLALARPVKRLNPNDKIHFADGFTAGVLDRTEDGSVLLQFNLSGSAFTKALERNGHIPLPPYINRCDDDRDRVDYQTVYAQENGAIAAPTAGLHFTPALLDKLKSYNIETAYVTLHVGIGTFQPVKVDDTNDHVMHHEWGEISLDVASSLTMAKQQGRRIIAVGTTSLRLLESASDDGGTVYPFAAPTDLFIMPGYRFKAVDALMTNFHLPRSTLYMLVSAFGGMERTREAYTHAIANEYRFYSYGDAFFLERSTTP
jgi:S-adenosylmethionine:tRNA ribosyltransferase-isomerase